VITVVIKKTEWTFTLCRNFLTMVLQTELHSKYCGT
jgi:hypothetical protein